MRGLAFVRFTAAWLLFAALYLLLAGEVSVTEIEAGAALAILIVAFVLLQRRIATRRINLPTVAKAYGRPLATVLPDAVRVGKVILASLVHRPEADVGYLLRQPFHAGGSSPAEAGRRAVVELGLSLAPNAFTVCLRPQDDELLLHCLHPKQASPDRVWPT